MSSPFLGIVADDLTGACDTAAQLATFGIASLCSVRPKGPLPDWGKYDALAVNTQSRCMPGREAARAVRQGMGTLEKIGPRLYFKKIDTALRGNIAEETLAAMESGFDTAILVAAIPRIGRTTRGGRQFLWGHPLEETHLVKDDLNSTPFSTSRIPEVFSGFPGVRTIVVSVEALRKPGACIPRLASSAREKIILIFDAETREDIDRIVRAALRDDRRFLYIGSLGLMEALAGTLKEEPGSSPPTAPILPGTPRRILIACGSPHPASRIQIDRLLSTGEARDLPLSLRDLETCFPGAAATEGNLLCMHLRPERRETGTTIDIPDRFAELVVRAVEKGERDCLILIGGETAYAVCRKLRIQTLETTAAFATVAAISKPRGKAQTPCSFIVTKGGSVGEPDILVSLIKTLTKKEKTHAS